MRGGYALFMANAICVRTTLESDNLRIPELLPFVGKKVQIIVVEDEPVPAGSAREPGSAAGAEVAPKRTLGTLRGRLQVPDDFDDPLPDDLLRAFEGEADE
jgi:hypothetical protein